MITRKDMSNRYQETRNKFLEVAKNANASITKLKHPLKGPSGEDLFLDVAQLGNTNSTKLVLIASGTHGIEGYLGSEIQTNLIQNLVLFEDLLASNLIVFIHGLNPYGMAWHRRVNENNVDLNRNFLDFDQTLPTNDEYQKLSSLVNPTRLEDEDFAKLDEGITRYIEKSGFMNYMKALSGGQYDFPEGVQYGGNSPQWSNLCLNQIWEDYGKNKALIINIDLHSGLGNPGDGVLMMNGSDNEVASQRAKKCWSDLLISPRAEDGSGSAILFGILNSHLENKFPATEVLAATLEFGTQDTNMVAKAMIADNWLKHHGDLDSEKGQNIKQQIMDAFYIDEDWFRDKTFQKALETFISALREKPSETPQPV